MATIKKRRLIRRGRKGYYVEVYTTGPKKGKIKGKWRPKR